MDPITLKVYAWKQTGPVRAHLDPFVHCQSYRLLVRVNKDYPKGTQAVLGIHLRTTGLEQPDWINCTQIDPAVCSC